MQNATATGVGSRAIAVTAAGAANVTVNGAVTAANAYAIDIDGGTTAVLTTAAGSSVFGTGNGANISSVTGTTVSNAGTLGGNSLRAVHYRWPGHGSHGGRQRRRVIGVFLNAAIPRMEARPATPDKLSEFGLNRSLPPL